MRVFVPAGQDGGSIDQDDDRTVHGRVVVRATVCGHAAAPPTTAVRRRLDRLCRIQGAGCLSRATLRRPA